MVGKMKDLQVTSKKTMTTKELAEALNVTPRTIQQSAEKLAKNNSSVFSSILRNNQGGYLFNQEQATAIKLELQNHSKVNSLTPKTELEKSLIVKQAMQILDENIAILRERAEKAEATNAILMHINKVYTITEIAKELGFRSGEELNNKLHEKGIQFKMNQTWLPYSKYADCGYF